MPRLLFSHPSPAQGPALPGRRRSGPGCLTTPSPRNPPEAMGFDQRSRLFHRQLGEFDGHHQIRPSRRRPPPPSSRSPDSRPSARRELAKSRLFCWTNRRPAIRFASIPSPARELSRRVSSGARSCLAGYSRRRRTIGHTLQSDEPPLRGARMPDRVTRQGRRLYRRAHNGCTLVSLRSKPAGMHQLPSLVSDHEVVMPLWDISPMCLDDDLSIRPIDRVVTQ